ncbi:DUF2972 domain-containing protein, partial [Campylobacter jejuni]
QRKIYKQIIQVFPHLTYPKLENCKDYNQALVYKLHLSYMIGTVLIQADKNKFKGGYFRLYKNMKQVRLFYNALKDFKENKNIPMKAFDILYKNINLISLEKIKEISFICDLHKDYIPILDNIYQNFEFVLKNIELIKEWLISDDFNQKYKKTNHPYPSLLDPRKLNDTNEKINYNNIPAELAWNMNLPLMGKFNKVFLLSPSSGTVAIQFIFLPSCKINFNSAWDQASKIYFCLYHMKNGDIVNNIFCILSNKQNDHIKNLFLIQNKVDVFCVYRDPVSIIKHALNHIGAYEITKITKKMRQINLVSDFYFPSIYYHYSKNYKPNLESIYNINFDGYFFIKDRLEILKPVIKNIECIEFSQINTTNAFNTFTKLAHKYGFTPPNDPILFQGRVNRHQGDLWVLPVKFRAHSYDLYNKTKNDSTSFALEGGVEIIITTHQLHSNKSGFVDITKEIFDDRKLMFDNIILLVKSNEYEMLKNNQELFLASKKYLNDYMDALEKHEQKIKDNLITEEQILDYLKDKKDLRIKLKQLIDDDLTYVRENHPEYLQKWKYYQEFEKLCEND